MTRFSFLYWHLQVSWCGAPTLTGGWICNLLVQLHLGLVRAVTFRCESRRTHNNILLSNLRLLQPGGPGWRYSNPPPHWSPYELSSQVLTKSKSKLHYDWQSVSMSWHRVPLWDLRPDIISCRNVTVWNVRSCICLCLCDERTGLQFVVSSLNGPSRSEPVTIFYCLIWDSPPTWRASSLNNI
jgi:hypothetical protein